MSDLLVPTRIAFVGESKDCHRMRNKVFETSGHSFHPVLLDEDWPQDRVALSELFSMMVRHRSGWFENLAEVRYVVNVGPFDKAKVTGLRILGFTVIDLDGSGAGDISFTSTGQDSENQFVLDLLEGKVRAVIPWSFVPDPPDQSSGDDDFYSLQNGYIKPSEILSDQEQIRKVREAVNLLDSFFDAIRAAGIREEM